MEKFKIALAFTYMGIMASMLGFGGILFVFGPTYKVNYIGMFMGVTGILMVIPLHIMEYLQDRKNGKK